MTSDYFKYQKFYNAHKAVFDKEDQERMRTLRVRHIIALGVGLSLSPLSYHSLKNIQNRVPPGIGGLINCVIILGPIVTSSYLARKYFINPHLEYIYHKYSQKDSDFEYFVEKNEFD